jgi:type IV fimbrial biogenesis protein FimT
LILDFPPNWPILKTGSRDKDVAMPLKKLGFTLMELILVIAIVGLAVMLAVPSWGLATQKRLLTSGAEQVTALLSVAQSEAILRNRAVSLSYTRSSDTQWCVGASNGATGCDCMENDSTEPAYCQLDAVLRRVASTDLEGVILTGASDNLPGAGDGFVSFDTVRGILQPAGDGLQFTFESSGGRYRLRVRLGPTGLIWLCSPEESQQVPGYGLCVS